MRPAGPPPMTTRLSGVTGTEDMAAAARRAAHDTRATVSLPRLTDSSGRRHASVGRPWPRIICAQNSVLIVTPLNPVAACRLR
jgi:hypothetical protein